MSESPAPRRIHLILSIFLILTLLLGSLVAISLWQPLLRPQASPVKRPGPFDARIIPGMRVSFITIAMDAQFIESHLGKATLRPHQDSLFYLFPKLGLNISTHKGQVTSILVTNPQYTVGSAPNPQNLIRVGQDVELVLRAFGDTYDAEGDPEAASPGGLGSRYTLHYWNQGIHFGIFQDRVQYILVTSNLLEPSDLPL